MSCVFCGVSGHNVRSCSHRGVSFALMKLRCKSWKSLQHDDLFISFNWINKQYVETLRIICIHKYKISPKTTSKIKLVAIIMQLEFGNIFQASDAFWKCNLPNDFGAFAIDCDNIQEKKLLIANINRYQAPEHDLTFMTNANLVGILMNLITEYRQTHPTNRHALYRPRIDYVEVIDNDAIDNECIICYDGIDSSKIARLGCSHMFCCNCIESHIRCAKNTNITCPLCNGEIVSISAVRNGNDSLVSIL